MSCMGQRVLAVPSLSAQPPDFRVYDTASSSWSANPPPPPGPPSTSGGAGPRVWTGAELLFLSTSLRLDTAHRFVVPWELIPGWAFNPTTSSWRTIPKFPTMPSSPLWTGHAVADYGVPLLQPEVDAAAGTAQSPRRPAAAGRGAAGRPLHPDLSPHKISASCVCRGGTCTTPKSGGIGGLESALGGLGEVDEEDHLAVVLDLGGAEARRGDRRSRRT